MKSAPMSMPYLLRIGSILIAYAAITAAETGSARSGPQVQSHPDCLWTWCGGVTDRGAVVALRWRTPVSARLAVYADGSSAPVFTTPDLPSTDGIMRAAIDGLKPGTAYRYGLIDAAGAAIGAQGIGGFATFPVAGAPASFSVACGSCCETADAPVFSAIAALRPALFIYTGDMHYGDDAKANPHADLYRAQYEDRLSAPLQSALLRMVPIAYVWDDHDGYSPWNHSTYRTLVPHYPLALPGIKAPIAQSFTIGRVHFAMPDLRTDRARDQIMKEPQMTWLLDEIDRASTTCKLFILVSSVPWNGRERNNSEGRDRWQGYAGQRRQIADRLKAKGLRACVISGDAHMVAIDDGANADFATDGGMPMPILQGAALSRRGSYKAGPYNRGAAPGRNQFGLIEVTDSGGPLTVTLSGRSGADGVYAPVVTAVRDGKEPITYTFTVP